MIKYLKNHNKYIRIFGKKFVNNNKDKVKIYENEIEMELTEYYKIDKSNDKEICIKLMGIINITDFSFMFYGCPALIEISELSLLNLSKVNKFLASLNKKELSYRFSQLDEFMTSNTYMTTIWEDFKKALEIDPTNSIANENLA